MKKTTVALAGAFALASIAFAAGESITQAAQDTSKIPELVKSLEGQKGSDFAADVISAIAAMLSAILTISSFPIGRLSLGGLGVSDPSGCRTPPWAHDARLPRRYNT